MNQGVDSRLGFSRKEDFCRKNAAVRYAMSPAYLVVIGSPQSESVDAQFSFVKQRIWLATDW
jgi:hypothetical protein